MATGSSGSGEKLTNRGKKDKNVAAPFEFFLHVEPNVWRVDGQEKITESSNEFAKILHKNLRGQEKLVENSLVQSYHLPFLHIDDIESVKKFSLYLRMRCHANTKVEWDELNKAISTGHMSDCFTKYANSIGLEFSFEISPDRKDVGLSVLVSLENPEALYEEKIQLSNKDGNEKKDLQQQQQQQQQQQKDTTAAKESSDTKVYTYNVDAASGQTGKGTTTAEEEFKSNDFETEFYVSRSFHIYVPIEPKDVDKVTIFSKDNKHINGRELTNSPKGSHLWLLEIRMNPEIDHFSYGFTIDYKLITITTYGPIPKSVYHKKESTHEHLVSKEYFHKTLDEHTSHYHIMNIFSDDDNVSGFQEFCIFIIGNTDEATLKERIMQLAVLLKNTKLRFCDKCQIAENIQKHFQRLFYRPRYLAFVAFLCFLFQSPTNVIRDYDYVKREVASSVLHALEKSSIEEIPTFCHRSFVAVLNELCRKVAANSYSVLFYMYYAYPFLSPETFLNMLDAKVPLVVDPSSAPSVNITQHVVKSLFVHVCENSERKNDQQLLHRILRQLPLDTFLPLLHVLDKDYRLKNERYQEQLEKILEILHFGCKREMTNFGKKGCMDKLLQLWEKISNHYYIKIEELQKYIEECVLNALDKTDGSGHEELQKACLYSVMFSGRESQLQLLMKLAETSHTKFHNLVIVFLRDDKFQNFESDELGKIVCCWLDCVMKKHFGDRRKPQAMYIPQLYSYLLNITTVPVVKENMELTVDAEDMAFEFLQAVDIKDVLKKIGDIEKLGATNIEETYKHHIQKLLRQGGGGKPGSVKTINAIVQQICGTTSLRVNSSPTFGVVEILMEMTGMTDSMPLDDAFMSMANFAQVWIKVLQVEGSKSDEVKRNSLYKKATCTIKHTTKQLLSGMIKCNVLQRLKTKTEDALGLLYCQSPTETYKVEKAWKNAFESIKMRQEECKMIIDVLQRCKPNIPKAVWSESVSKVIANLTDLGTDIQNGTLELHSLNKESFFGQHFVEITQHCSKLKTVVCSKCFWNVCKDVLDFSGMAQIKSEDDEDDDDSVLKSVSILFDPDSLNIDEGETCGHTRLISNLLKHLVHDGLVKYSSSWLPYIQGQDVALPDLQKQFEDADFGKEMDILECLHYMLNRESKNALLMYSNFEKHATKVDAMKNALEAFNVNFKSDPDFAKALTSFERLRNEDKSDKEDADDPEAQTLFGVYDALLIVEKVTDLLNEDLTDILFTAGKSKTLVEFLHEVADEDIRNLIDAVEEHSEQYVQESTVSSLIDIKRFFQPLLKSDFSENVPGFFSAISKSLTTSGIKNIPQKLHDCMDNLHSLKALYKNVANRGERTKEIVENVVKKGQFHFVLDVHKCHLTVEYRQDKKTITHNEAGLNDLRSRALLIVNTDEKKQTSPGTGMKTKDNLGLFVRLIDIAFDISSLLNDLQFSGHFSYTDYNKKISHHELESHRDMLKNEYQEWCDILAECRSKYYLMNFIYSDHIPLLHQYFDRGMNQNMIVPILKFIHQEIEISEDIRMTYKSFGEYGIENPKMVLENIGKTIHSLMKFSKPVRRDFKISQTTKKLSDIVQVNKIYVAALEEGSTLTIRTLLALYLNTTGHLPEAHQVLFCRNNTRWDEIMILLQRCQGAFEHTSSRELFCITNVEMLSIDLQFKLVDKLRNLLKESQFHLCIICRGNERHPFLDQFRECIMHPRPLTDVQMKKCFTEQWPNTITVTSDLPGLGKTEKVKQDANQNNMAMSTLHISGPFQKKSLVERLVHLKLKPYHVLHIDIGMTDNPVELDSFLFELIILGCVSAGTTAFFLPVEKVYIEVANTVSQALCSSLTTVTCFNRINLKWEDYKNFKVSMEINSPVQVVCHYLKVLEDGSLDKCDLVFTGSNRLKPLPSEECRKSLQKHFSTAGDLSFTIINIFLNVLADQLKKLSASVYFRTPNLNAMLGDKKIHSVKSNLVRALVDVSKEFSARSIHSCRSTQAATLSSDDSKSEKLSTNAPTAAEVLAMRVAGMIRWEDSNHLMVLFHQDVQTVSALYRDKSKVPEHVRNLIKSQINRELEDFHCKSQKDLQDILQRLARMKHPHLEEKVLKEMSENYALTPDNLLKMVLVVLRIKAHIPVIIMGETGCGKTSLVRYLSQICAVTFKVMSIHAGVTEEDIITTVMNTHKEAKHNFGEQIWLFLDEINTCDHLGIICDIICHHRCLDISLAPNLVVVAACNPYRLREEDSIFTAGLQGKIKSDELSRLVYRVHPLPETVVDYVWDYGSLSEKDENAYICRMIYSTFEDQKLSDLLSDLLTASQAFVRSTEGTESCVSLRDVDRCKRLVKWFIDILQKKKNVAMSGSFVFKYISTEIYTKAIVLALALCYHSRFVDTLTRTAYRETISNVFVKHDRSGCQYRIKDEKDVLEIIQKEQRDIIDRMDLPEGTAKNTALQENVFVILVCILNRIPVFVVGKPGCSKSLSMQLIRSNLRGKDSRDPFFQMLPQLYCVSFQGSESSTSDGIIKVFDKAKRYQEHNKIEDVMSVVILDEIGLAEISRFNPLKVLHSLLEPENKICPDVAVVGISNWSLDAAKMNRAIHLSRPEMDMEELFQTGISISESIFLKPESTVKTLQPRQKKQMPPELKPLLSAVARAYHEYNNSQKFKNFHGLRDYYSLTKYVSRMLLLSDFDDTKEVASVLSKGIHRNFGGLPSELGVIKAIFQKHLEMSFDHNTPVLELIREDIFDRIGRHLMLITSGDSVVGKIEHLLNQNGKEYMIIFGSQFEEDLTDDYNYRILSEIILCMEQGLVLILKDLEGIYGSLYDMLNQNYTVVGQKKNCRVALGPYSNPMCQVHDDFKCIVLVEEKRLDFSDPPFLNRFEKQQFGYADILDKKDYVIIERLESLIEDISSIEHHHFTPYDAFPIYSTDMLASLVLFVRDCLKDDHHVNEIVELCSKHLLQISTPEAVLRIKRSALWKSDQIEAKELLEDFLSLPLHNGLDVYFSSKMKDRESLVDVDNNSENDQETMAEDVTSNYPATYDATCASTLPCLDRSAKDMYVIFTHSNIHINLTDCIRNKKYQAEKVGGFKSEKQLTSRVQMFFKSDNTILILQFSATEDASHILLTKSAVENAMASFRKEKAICSRQKVVCMIIHLERKGLQQNSISQLNFLSGWSMITLDTLEKPRICLNEAMDMSISQILWRRRPLFECIKDQLFWAFTSIQYTSASHSIQNMKELLHKMQHNTEFLEDIEKVVLKWIEEQSSTMSSLDWQVDIACNQFALSCATTLMDAIESHILDMIRQPLAMIIFRLEEANASECYFIDDVHSVQRKNVWCELVHNSSFLNLREMKPPTGPECYICTSPALKMKMPFSQVIITKAEQLESDFMYTLKKLKSKCEIEEDEIPLELFMDLVSKYQDIVVQEVGDLVNLDYDGKREDYIHDFSIFVLSKTVFGMDEEIGTLVLRWGLSHYMNLSVMDFGELITQLHTAFWTYSPKLLALLQLIELSKDVLDNDLVEVLHKVSTPVKSSTSWYHKIEMSNENIPESLEISADYVTNEDRKGLQRKLLHPIIQTKIIQDQKILTSYQSLHHQTLMFVLQTSPKYKIALKKMKLKYHE